MSTYCDRDHTWAFDSPGQTTAPNYVTETVGFEGLVGMSFEGVMSDSDSLESIASASFANIEGTEPTIGSPVVSDDKRKAHLPIDASAATAGAYTVTVTVETVDGQTYVRKGRLVVE